MSPDGRAKRAQSPKGAGAVRADDVRTKPSSDDAHDIVFFQRHFKDDREMATPGRKFLKECPAKVKETMNSTLIAVATAPPKSFSGGGYWEAMKGSMTGWFEVRVDGPGRKVHYRLFCLLDYEAELADPDCKESKPLLVVITGLSKLFGTTFEESDYAAVRELGREYRSRNPRSIS